MQKCRNFAGLLLTMVVVLALCPKVWGLSGSVTDNRIGAGGATLMVFAVPHQAQIDPYLVEIECMAPVAGTYPNYSFDLPCVTAGNYDIGIVGWDGTPDSPPSFVTDIKLDLPFDTGGISLSVQPNANHISGDLYDLATASPVRQSGEVWAFNPSGQLVGIAFSDSLGHYDFGYLLGGGGPYNLIAKVEGYWQGSSAGVNNPATEYFVLGKAFQAEITNSLNTGYNYNYTLHPERKSWVLSDATNYDLTVAVKTATPGEGALPLNWVMFRLPGGGDFSLSKFYANSSPFAHSVGASLDWDSIYVDQTGVQDKVVFTQGTGVLVVLPQDSAQYTIEVASMDNVPRDNYTSLEVIVSNDGGNNKAYANAWLVQKILRIQNISFFPDEVDTTNQAGPGSYVTLSASVENHGTATFTPYDNWSGIWSPAFASPGTKISPGSVGPGSFGPVALLDAQITGVEGNYEVFANVSDSGDQNTSYIAYQEPLQVISTGVGDQNNSNLLPQGFSLSQNFPNPFNASTRIDYALSTSGSVSLEIYNLLGQKVRTLASGYQTLGYKSFIWDGKDSGDREVPSGIYFYRLKTAQGSFTKKMVLIR